MSIQIHLIPERAGDVDGWQRVPLSPDAETLVAIGQGTEYDDIMTSAVYAGEHLHSPYRDDNVIDAVRPIIYVRASVAERLRHAQSLLPDGMRLIVFDGYRSVAVQQALYDQFLSELRLLQPDWDDVQLREETEQYVSLPSTDPMCPSPHLTGGAVDVAIIRDNHMIEFGTPFDHGTERSALRYFENDAHVMTAMDAEARDNRRLLYGIMHDAGFEGFEHEWWHFNAPETQMGARSLRHESATFGDGTAYVLENTFSTSAKVNVDSEEPRVRIDRIAPSN